MSPYSTQNEDLQYSDRFAVGLSLVGALIMSLFCLGVLVVCSPLLNFSSLLARDIKAECF